MTNTEIIRENATYRKCKECQWLSIEKCSIGRRCINPNKIWRSNTAMWHAPSCKACKMFKPYKAERHYDGFKGENMTELEKAIRHIKTRADAWAVKEIEKALSQEPCEDTVSRNMALEKMADYVASGYADSAEDFEEYSRIICQLPSVTQKQGKWIEHPEIETSTPEYLMFYECSECGDKQCFYKSDIHKKRFCTYCGAKMESEDKE